MNYFYDENAEKVAITYDEFLLALEEAVNGYTISMRVGGYCFSVCFEDCIELSFCGGYQFSFRMIDTRSNGSEFLLTLIDGRFEAYWVQCLNGVGYAVVDSSDNECVIEC